MNLAQLKSNLEGGMQPREPVQSSTKASTPWHGSRGSAEGDLQSNPRSVNLSMHEALEDEQGDMPLDKHVVAIKQRHDKQTNKHTA